VLISWRTVLPLALLVSAAFVIASCGDDDDGDSGDGGGEVTTVTYAQPTPPSLLFYPPIVAETLGFFEDEGVSAELAPAAEEIPMTAFVETGDADIALADLDEVAVGVAKGGDYEVVFCPQHSATEGTVVPADSPIEEFGELAGRTVGLASEENTGIFEAQLEAAGVSADDVETVVVGTSGPTVANAVNDGEIDAYTAAVSDFTALQANDIDLRNITPPEVAALPGNPMMVSPETLESKRDALVGFLRAWAMAQYVGFVNPDVVEQIVRDEVPEEWRKEEVGEAALTQAIELFQPEGDLIGELRPDVWENGQELLASVGIIEQTAPADEILNDELIEEINDFDRAEVEARAEEYAAQGS
jgi:NitT/TauT family transport system substrate-binding protein